METTEIRRDQLEQASRYFLARVAELRKMCDDGTPWVFLCASAFIEYLSTLTESSAHNGPRFKKFIREFMPNAYSEFTYQQSGTNDLPEQMWHVLRCGIVHSFSLLPDSKAHDKVGRNRSIALTHEPSAQHLSQYTGPDSLDACLLVAGEFIADIEVAVQNLFANALANPNSERATHLLQRFERHPPITGRL